MADEHRSASSFRLARDAANLGKTKVTEIEETLKLKLALQKKATTEVVSSTVAYASAESQVVR